MKQLILLILLVPLLSKGQPSLPQVFKTVNSQTTADTVQKDTIKHIMLCMLRAGEMMKMEHKRYRTGLHMSLIGTAGSMVFYYVGTKDPANNELSFAIAGACTVMNIIGVVLMIDSHKFTGKAGYYLKQAGSTLSVGMTF